MAVEVVGEPSEALVRRDDVLKPVDTERLLDSFGEYQKLLKDVLEPSDWQGRPGADESFVKKSGWRKIATAFNLDVELLRSEVSRDENGEPVRAEAWARALAPNGRRMDGDGYCDASEPRFKRQKGRLKLENDLRATATTRAKNRAIADLVGMGDVSAEEVDQPSAPPASLPFGVHARDGQIKQTRAAIKYVLECDELAVTDLLAKITAETGESPYLPYMAFRGIALLATAVKGRRETPAQTTIPHGGDPHEETPEEREEREHAERVARGHDVLNQMP